MRMNTKQTRIILVMVQLDTFCFVLIGSIDLFIVFVIVTSSQGELDILPQLTLVVVFVPFGHGDIEGTLESKGTGEDGCDVDRVSSVKERK